MIESSRPLIGKGEVSRCFCGGEDETQAHQWSHCRHDPLPLFVAGAPHALCRSMATQER